MTVSTAHQIMKFCSSIEILLPRSPPFTVLIESTIPSLVSIRLSKATSSVISTRKSCWHRVYRKHALDTIIGVFMKKRHPKRNQSRTAFYHSKVYSEPNTTYGRRTTIPWSLGHDTKEVIQTTLEYFVIHLAHCGTDTPLTFF